ncbi:hypothetical protein MHYP_G00313410 [Metynnis hypsauchen]
MTLQLYNFPLHGTTSCGSGLLSVDLPLNMLGEEGRVRVLRTQPLLFMFCDWLKGCSSGPEDGLLLADTHAYPWKLLGRDDRY